MSRMAPVRIYVQCAVHGTSLGRAVPEEPQQMDIRLVTSVFLAVTWGGGTGVGRPIRILLMTLLPQ